MRNASGMKVGKIDSDGTVRGSNGMSIGKVEKDGTVRGKNGIKIGKVDSPKNKEEIAYWFFFK